MSVSFGGGNVGRPFTFPTSPEVASPITPWLHFVDLGLLMESSFWKDIVTAGLMGFSIYGLLRKSGVAISMSLVLVLTGILLLILGLDASGHIEDSARSALLCSRNMTNPITQGAISLDFAGLTVRKGRGAGGTVIVNNVTGTLEAGQLHIILGGAGAGKSTLLSALMGHPSKLRGLSVSGSLSVNNIEVEVDQGLKPIRHVLGFMPQEGTMYSRLTIKQNLEFQRGWRARAEAKLTSTIEMMDQLRLSHVKDNWCVESQAKSRISLGQKKFVNLGMELFDEPGLLFLDEPTTGCDSTDALRIVETLKGIRDSKGTTTVIAIIHQPSTEIFRQFDRLTLLVAGGTIVYQGPTDRATAYFDSLGYHYSATGKSAHVTESEFLMKVLAGEVVRNSTMPLPADLAVLRDDTPNFLTSAWRKHLQSTRRASRKGPSKCIPRSRRASWAKQFWLVFWRDFQLDWSADHFYTLLMLVGVAAALGFTRTFNDDRMDTLPQALNVFSTGTGLVLMSICAYMLAEDVDIREREMFAGLNMLAYFCARNVYGLFRVFLAPAAFLCIYHIVICRRLNPERSEEWRAHPDWVAFHRQTYLLMVIVAFICQSFAMILPLLSGNINMGGMVLLVIILHVFGGNNPRLKSLEGAAARIVDYSYVRHFLSLMLTLQPIPAHWDTAMRPSKNDVLEQFSCKGEDHHTRKLISIALLSRTVAFWLFCAFHQQSGTVVLIQWVLYILSCALVMLLSNI